MKYNDIQPYTLAFHKFFMVAKQNTDFFFFNHWFKVYFHSYRIVGCYDQRKYLIVCTYSMNSLKI